MYISIYYVHCRPPVELHSPASGELSYRHRIIKPSEMWNCPFPFTSTHGFWMKQSAHCTWMLFISYCIWQYNIFRSKYIFQSYLFLCYYMLLRNKWSFSIFIKEACIPGWDCMLSVTEPFFLTLHLNVHMRILLSLCLCAVLLWTKCLILKSTVTGLVTSKVCHVGSIFYSWKQV